MKKFGKLVAGVMVGICWWGGSSTLAHDKIEYRIAPKLIELTETEKFVLQKAATGEMADLKNLKSPAIRGKFLEALLTSRFSGFAVDYRGVKIRNAIITDKVDLQKAVVPFNVYLDKCVFQGDVNFEDTVFEKNLDIRRSHFRQEAYFLKMRVKISAYFKESVFEGLVNFSGADISEAFNAEGGRFNWEEKIHFSAFRVGKKALFNNAKFRGTVFFNNSKVGELQMRKVDFCRQAEFRSLKTDYDALFGYARFYGGAGFAGANIGRDYEARGAQFLSETDYASFFGLKVGHVADFSQKAVFHGPVDFGNAEVALNFTADGAEFLEADRGVEATGMTVGSIASFKGAIFHGPVNFSGSSMKGQLNAEKAQFLHDFSEVDCSGINVGQLAKFTGAVFKGDVTFLGANIGGELERDMEQGTRLEDVVMHHGKICLRDARLSDLSIKGPDLGPLIIPELNLERTHVERSLTIYNVNLDNLRAWNLQSNGQTILQNVAIKQEADLRDSRFLNLKLFGVTWPAHPENCKIAGLTYQSVCAVAEPVHDRDWEPVKKWIENSKFDKRNYLQFEDFLQRSGYDTLADKVYIQMKQEEWQRSWSWDLWHWPSNILRLVLVDWGVGYGRRPLRAFIPCLVIIGAGMLVFSRQGALTWDNSGGKNLPVRKAFWYSLDLFIPFLSFGPDKHYQIPLDARVKWAELCTTRLVSLFPEGCQSWLQDHSLSVQTYSYIHQIAGYILIPIGLAAVTGIIK